MNGCGLAGMKRLLILGLLAAAAAAAYVAATEISFRMLGNRERTCRGCGCTDERACLEGCWWVAYDLCSACDNDAEIDDEPGGGFG